MLDADLLVACVLLAAATYLVRLCGVVLGQQGCLPESTDRTLDAAIAVLLAAVAATSMLYDGQELADWPRTAGVLAGSAAAMLRAPLIVVIMVAGGTACVLRLVT